MRSVAILVLSAAVAQGQQDSTARDTARLSPTTVTVLRTSVQLERAPFAVSVATKEQIQRGKPGFALDEALAGVPGVQVDNRFNYALGERISIRGFGSRAQFGVRGIRVLLDGIPMTTADGQTTLNNVDVASLARVEVIRGPASAMHGNAAGGVIQMESDLGEEFAHRRGGGEARISGGEDGLMRYQITTRTSSPRIFAVVTASQLKYDGYRDWNTADNTHLNFLIGQYLQAGTLNFHGNFVEYDARNPGGLPRDSATLKPFMAWPNNKTRFLTGENGWQMQGGVTWRQNVRGAVLDLSGHALTRSIDNPIPQTIVVVGRDGGGLRAALSGTPLSRVNVAGGVEWQLQSDERQNYVNTPNTGARGAITLDQSERVSNSAAFMQLSAALLPTVDLMAGLRVDRVKFTATDRLVTASNPDDSGDRTMAATSPSVGITWRAAPVLDLFANVSTSFETPTTSELANQQSGAGGFNPNLEPQRTRSAEVGVNGRIRVAGVAGAYQLTTYLANVDDALIPFEVASAPGRQYFRNAGSTEHRGVEFGTSLVLPANLALRGAFTHTQARFDSYAVTTGTTTTVFDGKSLPGVAPNRGDATLGWHPSRLFFEWETRGSSRLPVNDANSERADSWIIHGARAGMVDIVAGPFRFAPHVGVFNLLDRRYMTSVVVNAFGGRYYEPGPPRSVYAGMSAKF
jgi:iron complex outermembrane receptor protein